jgi:hypothetical protein
MFKLGCAVLFLAGAPFLFGQDELNRLVAESVPLRASKDVDWTQQKNALRDWIESRLPRNITALDADFSNLEARLNGEIQQAGLTEPVTPDYGFWLRF